jgi:hypothetical protein
LNQFEFLFSLYGLLLGLGVADLAAGSSRAYDRRKAEPIGWLAPGLAALLICDLLTFWAGAWRFRDVQVTYYLMLAATAVGLIYYFAASQVWPREGSAEATDDHAMTRRRLIALSIFVINVAVFFVPTAAEWIAGDASAWLANAMNALYVAVLMWLFLAPTRRQAALAAWSGVAFLVIGVGIVS